MAKDFLNVPFSVKADDVEDSGTFKGVASTFGGKPDSHNDVVAPGAFQKSLEKGGRNETGVALLYQHRSDKPIGVWKEITETPKGLQVLGQLEMKLQLAQDVHALLKQGALKGLSIGFNTIVDEFDSKTRIRTLKEVDLWEISVVTFPANTRAKITSVKDIRDITTVREIEAALRDAEGLSKSDAQYIASLCKNSLRDAENNDEEETVLIDILSSLKKANKDLEGCYMDTILQKLRHINR